MAIRKFALTLEAIAMLTACSGQPTNTTTEAATTPAVTESVATTTVTEAPTGSEATTGSAYTLDDVAKHATKDDCWTAIDGVVYDLTKFASSHPGGEDKIIGLCGKDGTDDFNGQHGSDDQAQSKLKDYEIGVLNS